MSAHRPTVTFILATHNRRETVLETLKQIEACGLERESFEIIVVDNDSTDGTSCAIVNGHEHVEILRLSVNRGSCAKGLAVDRARGRYIVFLDDDSYPRCGSIERMIGHFEADERLAAAGFVVHLPDGGLECSALPNVFIGCGVGLRASALRKVGGLDVDLFMQAEEYDLSFRLINAGMSVETFADLHVDHLKSPRARMTSRTVYYDTRNNLLLTQRYLPDRARRIYARDWRRRYRLLAELGEHRGSYVRGMLAARTRGPWDRRRFAAHRLSKDAFETLFRWQFVRTRMERLRADGIRRVVFADLGKNVYAFLQGAQHAGVSVAAIADDRFATVASGYRGIPLIETDRIADLDVDAIVISNTSPVHAAQSQHRLAAKTPLPTHAWFAEAAGGFDESSPIVHVPCASPSRVPTATARSGADGGQDGADNGHHRAGRLVSDGAAAR